MPKFVPRVRKHKVRQRLGNNGGGNASDPVGTDSNAMEIASSEREKKKKAIKDDLRAQQPKMSGKKQKRLEKYIVCNDRLSSGMIKPTHLPG